MIAEVVILMSNHEEKASIWKRMQVKMKRLMRKRWALPAIFLTLTAIVLATFLWITGNESDIADHQQDSQFDINNDGHEDAMLTEEDDAVPVTTTNEVFQLPVLDENEVEVVGTFFDYESSKEEQVNSLIRYDNYYHQNKGIDLASEEGESFDVTAAMSGTVVKAEEDALFGQVVHIEHDKDVVTIYQSLEGLLVEVGQTVKQGDVIGRAGRNLFNKDAGVHVHFEIRKDGVPVNPLDYLDKTLAALPNVETDEDNSDNNQNNENNENNENDRNDQQEE